MVVMYKILKMFEWTDTDSCIVQLLRILPSIRQPPQHLKVAARAATHPSIAHSHFQNAALPRLPPQPQVGRPAWRVRPQRPAPRKPSQADPPSHSIFFGSGSQTSKTVPRSRSPVGGRIPRRRLSSSLHPPAPWHCSSCPVCGASYVHIIIREALVFGFARWMDGIDECGGG